MHSWYDKDADKVDWEGINDAAEFIHDYCIRWGRLGGQYKEKYGTVRFYPMWSLSLHHLLYPGHCFYRWPKWVTTFDLYVFTPVCQKLGLSKLWNAWQKKVYSDAYLKAILKWPHLRAEILCGADHVEYVKGVTRREGKKLHILGWNNEILNTWNSG